ncbi:hypothetical protein N0V93_000184 [Gnomoniopsis smithogilvyi]|uniref:Rhodopsin domain-containing protein n=1 Tax=Gnomoniopsis smithogilvyi TaxID=1191159 RepID=A0A9W8Z1B4_9PEZI|nr:hypothetical protein N0V93_000184 [Gnomoniopsis smithogilvyi]
MSLPVIEPDSDGVALITVATVFATLAVIAVSLRIWARQLMRAPLAPDDYLALASILVFIVEVPVFTCWVLFGGAGSEEDVVLAQSPMALQYYLKLMYVSQYLYGFSASAIKLSLLAFYWRIFPTPFVRRGVYILGFCCIGWFIAIMITNILECRPISFFWTQSGDGSCSVDLISYFKYNCLSNTFIDLLTLCLPIHEVLRLQMSNTKKVAVIGVFTVGSLVVIASIVRFASLVILSNQENSNITKNWSLMAGATIVEVYIAIIGACAVTLGPVYRRLRYGHPQGSSKSRPLDGGSLGTHLDSHSRSRGSRIMGKFVPRSRNSFELLDKDADSQTRIVVGETRTRPPSKGIMVERNVEWTESQPAPKATSAPLGYGWNQV